METATLFHEAHVYMGESDVRRKDVTEPDAVARETADAFLPRLKPNAKLFAAFGTSGVSGEVLFYTKMGAMVCQLSMPGIVGVASLFLTGRVRATDEKACRLYERSWQKFGQQWPLPTSPQEMEPRPLFFHALFNLDSESDLWRGSAHELLSRANGLGLAFLGKMNVK